MLELPKPGSRQAIYQGDIAELMEKKTGEYIGRDQECVALPQALTNVGHTSTWLPGPKVVDLVFLLPGTVIANFKFENGVYRFPNQHRYHAALFLEFGPRNMTTGGYDYIWMFDQWNGEKAKRRHKLAYSPEQAKREGRAPADNANEFFVVAVP